MAEELEKAEPDEAEDQATFVHFVTGAGPRLVDVREVVEVIPMVYIDRDGNAQEGGLYRGLLNYRGRVIPVFDLAMGSEGDEISPENFLIVTESGADRGVAIIAREVDQLIDVPSVDISRIDPTGEEGFTVAKTGDEMLRVVSAAEFLQ